MAERKAPLRDPFAYGAYASLPPESLSGGEEQGMQSGGEEEPEPEVQPEEESEEEPV